MPCIIIHHPYPSWSANRGDTWLLMIAIRNSMDGILEEKNVSINANFVSGRVPPKQPFEIPSIRLTHLATAFSWLFGNNSATFSIFARSHYKIPYKSLEPGMMVHHLFHSTTECHHGDTWIPRISVRTHYNPTRTVLTWSGKGIDVTSRLIASGPFDPPFRWICVFQPPGSRPPASWVTTQGKRFASCRQARGWCVPIRSTKDPHGAGGKHIFLLNTLIFISKWSILKARTKLNMTKFISIKLYFVVYGNIL